MMMMRNPGVTLLLRRVLIFLVCFSMLAMLGSRLIPVILPHSGERHVIGQDGGSILLLDREGGMVAWRVDSTDSLRVPIRIDNVSDSLVKATIAAEDKRFWSHRGVDPYAVARASFQSLAARRFVSGASTITMQTMRMTRPQERTFKAKCSEAIRALQFETVASKKEILELYFNMAPYGGNIVGAEAAALRYFGKSAADLTLGEATMLAGIPKSPARLNPRRHLKNALARREYVFARMLESGFADEREIAAARREEIAVKKCIRTTFAPRFADYVIRTRGGKGGTIRTTLDPEIQAAAVNAADEHYRQLEEMGIEGLAVVVIDVRESELLAMVGTADPTDPINGYVNCATSRRQPGSLLKPFIYTTAFSTGEITPKSLMYDVPMSWEGYKPENIDRSYLGPISADEALIKSRNIPAVDLLDRIGTFRVSNEATSLGLDIGGSEIRCGLSLALGTAEVSLVDITNAYAALGREGVYEPLRVELDELPHSRKRIYPEGAVYLTLRSLGAPVQGKPGRAIWKTGTSWNYRDAWAVALTPDYAVGVWCGNYSGGGHPALIGAHAALPLALEVIGRVSGPEIETWEPPETVRTRTVCALSGHLPSSACPHLTESEYIPGVSSEVPCTMHRYAGTDGGRTVVTAWPGNVVAFMASRNGKAKSARSVKPAIEITSPRDASRYIMAGVPGPNDCLTLSSRTDIRRGRVYWFVDGELFAAGRATEPIEWGMSPGTHELVACTSDGTSAQIGFNISQME